MSGINIMQMNAGIDSVKSANGIFFIGSIMSKPTIMSTGAVADDGIERKSGEKKSVIAKQHATANAVSPERPPWSTPAALSTYVVVVDFQALRQLLLLLNRP